MKKEKFEKVTSRKQKRLKANQIKEKEVKASKPVPIEVETKFIQL